MGVTAFAENLTWDQALEGRRRDPRIRLLELDLRRGSAATCLDLPRRDAALELRSGIETGDVSGILSALDTREGQGARLSVLAAPQDALPLDIVGAEGISQPAALRPRQP